MSDFICPECEKGFSSETSLQEHNLAVHSSQNHVCFVCHKVLKDSAILESHVTAHEKLLHCCNVCGELCENKGDVFVHVTTSHKYGGKIICDLCSETFSSTSDLKVHSIDKHAPEMSQVLQKWELFCNIHSSQNLSQSDAMKGSLDPSDDCPTLPTNEKELRDETDPSNVLASNQSILSSEAVDDTERQSACPDSALTEFQTFLHEQGDKESWFTKSTDHLSCSIRPSDILDRIRPVTENENRLQEDRANECSLCDKTFSSRNDYKLAHDGKDPSSVCPHKQEEKPSSQTRVQEVFEHFKSIRLSSFRS